MRLMRVILLHLSGLRIPKPEILSPIQKSLFCWRSITFPAPVISVAIEPERASDADALEETLEKLMDEDPTFTVGIDKETGQRIISGMGELHLEILTDRMIREFGVNARVSKLQVAYREDHQ